MGANRGPVCPEHTPEGRRCERIEAHPGPHVAWEEPQWCTGALGPRNCMLIAGHDGPHAQRQGPLDGISWEWD